MADVNVQLGFIELADDKDDQVSAGETFRVDVSFVPDDTQNTVVIGGGVDLIFDPNLVTANEIIYDADFDETNSG